MLNHAVYVEAFTEAARKLGFAFTAPYSYQFAGSPAIQALGLVHEFGAPNGTLLFLEHMQAPSTAELRSHGLSYSRLGESYGRYDEALFKATLNDWQFYGSSKNRPAWYTGEPW